MDGIRLPPKEAPYSPEVDAALQALMPKDAVIPPLVLFRELVHNLPLANAVQGFGSFFLGARERTGRALPSRERELVILRVCARCGCEYEWGVHAVAYGPRVGLTDEQVRSTVTTIADPDGFDGSAKDRLLLRVVDELHHRARISPETWQKFSKEFTPAQCLEVLVLSGWYHAIAYLANGLELTAEPWAPRFSDGH